MHASCFNNAAPFLVITCAGLAWHRLCSVAEAVNFVVESEVGFNNSLRENG